MPKGKIRNQFFPNSVQDELSEIAEVTWNTSYHNYSNDDLLKAAQKFDVFITGWGSPKISSGVISKSSRLKLILHTGATLVPYVDQTTFKANIRIASASHIYARSVAEGNLAYILAGLRQIPYWDAQTKQGLWRTDDFDNQGLFDKKVGIIGFGEVTQFLIPMLHLFTNQIFVYSNHLSAVALENKQVKKASLETIFDTCDIITIQAALTDKTRGMINRNLLDRIKASTLLVNTARGELIDEKYLYQCLKTASFSAVLDVYGTEPVPADNPFVGKRNVISLPHQAGPTQDQYISVGRFIVQQIKSYQKNGVLKNESHFEDLAHMSSY
jgi:phosphoglycerate dehydrogenase-like enzyme